MPTAGLLRLPSEVRSLTTLGCLLVYSGSLTQRRLLRCWIVNYLLYGVTTYLYGSWVRAIRSGDRGVCMAAIRCGKRVMHVNHTLRQRGVCPSAMLRQRGICLSAIRCSKGVYVRQPYAAAKGCMSVSHTLRQRVYAHQPYAAAKGCMPISHTLRQRVL